jgi:hypothetical protein
MAQASAQAAKPNFRGDTTWPTHQDAVQGIPVLAFVDVEHPLPQGLPRLDDRRVGFLVGQITRWVRPSPPVRLPKHPFAQLAHGKRSPAIEKPSGRAEDTR